MWMWLTKGYQSKTVAETQEVKECNLGNCHWKKYTHITTKERKNNLIIKYECTSGISATITLRISSFTWQIMLIEKCAKESFYVKWLFISYNEL